MFEKAILISTYISLAFAFSTPSAALEPVSALDDGFAVPSTSGMIEASLHFPGAESFLKGPFALIGWTRPFGVEDLSVVTFHAGTGFRKGGVSLSYSGTGFELYGDETEKIGFSYPLMDNLSCGIRLTRSAMRIKGFGDASALSADMGIVLRPLETVYLAGSIEDLKGAELGDSHEPLDGRTRLSAAWKLHTDITLLASLSKVRLYDVSFTGGFTAALAQSFTVGVTGANEPDRMEFLGMFCIRGMTCSYRGSYHRDLGLSHGFSINWAPKEKHSRITAE
jgi:hypothetical protein